MAHYQTKTGKIVQLNEQHVTDLMVKNLGLTKLADSEVPKPDILKGKGKAKKVVESPINMPTTPENE